MSTPDITTVPGFRTDMTAEERVQLMTTRNDDPFGPVIRNGREYNMARDLETGLVFVFADGVKIGQTQTYEAARMIRRNHSRAAVTLTPWEHEPPTPR